MHMPVSSSQHIQSKEHPALSSSFPSNNRDICPCKECGGGSAEARMSSPEVPRDTTHLPSCTAPAPSALIWLSPLPGATMTSVPRPSCSATSDLSVPTTWRAL